jgi:uncharacterized membrane protein
MENISFMEAWGHAASFFSYWAWLIPATLLMIFGYWRAYQLYQNEGGWKVAYSVALFVVTAIFAYALLATPAEVAANTTVDMAARGVYIGR